jgi:hypothetical protein
MEKGLLIPVAENKWILIDMDENIISAYQNHFGMLELISSLPFSRIHELILKEF